MKRRPLSNTFVYIIANILFAYFLVGCQPNQRAGVNLANSSTSGHSGATASGPIDSGGENLINGVPLESYRVDITTTDEFKLLKPYLYYLSVAYSHDFIDFAKMRNWYFVPVSLANLSNKSVGVDLKNGTTQTIALQGRDEIWVDDNLYKKQSAQEKAKIILHEIVRTLNGLKYKSIKETCRDWLKAGNTCEKYQLSFSDTKKMQPLPSPNNGDTGDQTREQDTSDIRDMTMWILSLNKNIPITEIYKRFATFNFDQRYFDGYPKSLWPSKHISISPDENDFLLEQILNVNNISSTSEKKPVFEISNETPSNPAASACSLNFVDPSETHKPYYIVPSKNDPDFNNRKEQCLLALMNFSSSSDTLPAANDLVSPSDTYDSDLRWVYGKMGPMVLYSAIIADPIPIRTDNGGQNVDLARDHVKTFSAVRRGYFLFYPTKAENSLIKDLQLISVDFETLLQRPSEENWYEAETTQNNEILECSPGLYGVPKLMVYFMSSTLNNGIKINRKNISYEILKQYFNLEEDPYFKPSCSITNISVATSDNLFSDLKLNPQELTGWGSFYGTSWAKRVEAFATALSDLTEQEHPGKVTFQGTGSIPPTNDSSNPYATPSGSQQK